MWDNVLTFPLPTHYILLFLSHFILCGRIVWTPLMAELAIALYKTKLNSNSKTNVKFESCSNLMCTLS